MTEEQIELKDKVINYVIENGEDGLTASEIDFLETMDNLSEEVKLSEAREEFLLSIANKLGVE